MNSTSSLPPSGADDHRWTRQHLVTAAVGLLTDGDEDRLQAHLAHCEECAAAWQEQMQDLAENAGDDRRHLPAAMVARWELATLTLRGLEREAVRAHLQECADCRADLTALGHRPELTSVTPLRPRRSFGAGLAWGAGVATVAAVLAGLALLPTRPSGDGDVLPWVAPVILRGGGPATLDLAADAPGFAILAAVPRELDLTLPAIVEVSGPGGAVVLAKTVTPELLAKRTLPIVIRDNGAIPGGDYQVVFTQTDAAGVVQSRTVAFRIVIRQN